MRINIMRGSLSKASRQHKESYGGKEVSIYLATLTAKGQVTIHKAVRDATGLKRGDFVSWELEDESVCLREMFPFWMAKWNGVLMGMKLPLRTCEVVSKADGLKCQPSGLLIQSFEDVQHLTGRC